MRKPTSYFLFLLLAFGFLSAFPGVAAADDDDPPGRVARLNYIQGSVSFQPDGQTDWLQANSNRPLTTGDNLWTDRDSRGELHIGSTAIRLWSETGITFLNLDDRTVQIQLAQGSLSVHLRRLDGGDAFEIDTPNLAFTVQRPGEYRVDVNPDGNATIITVREGEGEATGGGSDFHLDTGERMRVFGTDSVAFTEGRAGSPDEFDEWCSSRDEREEHAQSARYVSRDVIGYEDLDEYGEWRSVPEYGTVWFPTRVAAGWAPYRYGHWVWIAPWGWTWVEDEPWGFAPFHYGRWAVAGGGWCWVPGPVVIRPVYAPALVAFVGGPRFSVSLSMGGGGGGVAWFPLGPHEVYVPARRASQRYVQNVNITNTTVNVVNVTNVYNNVNVNKVTYMHQNNVTAVTAVSHDTFVNARPVAAATVRVNPQQLRSAEIQRGASAMPERKSIIGAGAPALANARPSEEVMRRQVVVKLPPPASPMSSPQGGRPPMQQGRPGMQQQGQPPVQQQGRPGMQQQAQPPVQQQGRPGVQQQAQPPVQQQGRPGVQQQAQPPVQQQGRPGMQQQAQPPVQQQGQPPVQQQGRPGMQQQGQPPVQQQGRPGMQQQAQPPVQQPQVEQQRPPVKFAPPARADENTYHPHTFERPEKAAPSSSGAETGRAKEQAPAREQESKKPAGGEQERKQSR
jgi:hypothetical protein